MADQSGWFPPKFLADAFNCPYCMAYAHQEWHRNTYLEIEGYWDPSRGRVATKAIRLSECQRCRKKAVWHFTPETDRGDLLHPEASLAEEPNEDLESSIKKDYEEAAKILSRSPSAAAALLRRAVERLCQQLVREGGEKKGLAENIKKLENDHSLAPGISEMLDTMRLAGNKAVHPGGFFEDGDNQDIAIGLFALINQIAHEAITVPRKREEFQNKVKGKAEAAGESGQPEGTGDGGIQAEPGTTDA